MAFMIIRNDITKVRADAIVNTANHFVRFGPGTDTAVYKAAGEKELLAERKRIGEIERGTSVHTDSFNLSGNGVKYIIHTVGGEFSEEKKDESVKTLRSCYRSAFEIAKKLECKSLAIPLLGTGNFKYPKELGLQIAVEEINKFLLETEMDLMLVVYDISSVLVTEKVFADIKDFLKSEAKIGSPEISGNDETGLTDLRTLLSTINDKMSFKNMLQKKIADRNLSNADVYKKAYIDRKVFSKIINPNTNYMTSKKNVMALALALELSLSDFIEFMSYSGYALIPSSVFDMIVKYCVMQKKYNLAEVNFILHSCNQECFGE